MDAIIKWISERLTERSSRRGFFSTMEKALLATAAIVTGGCSTAQDSARVPAPSSLLATFECCDPRNTPCSAGNVCPSGSSVQYAWLCHTHDGSQYQCIDCYDNSMSYVCSYTLKTN